jgi:hypothetical protein
VKISQTILIAVLILFLFPSISTAQLVKVGAGGGITNILGPDVFKNESNGYGFSTEWNLGAIGKIDLPIVPITPRAFILYHSFSGTGDYNLTTPAEFTQSILEVGVGAQYNFVPIPAGIDPYIALDLSFNSFSKLKGNDIVVPNKEVTRFGGGIGIGTEVTIIPLINLDFYLSYKMFNLTGKEDGEETVSAVTLDAFIIFNFL